jgi:uncharacterized membrane protein YiaA
MIKKLYGRGDGVMNYRRRNTQAFTFLAWTSFVLSCAFMFIGLYNMDAPLVEKGYYAVCACFLIMSSFVLQKTIRDNAEDDAYEKEHMPKKFEKEETK